MGSLPNLWLRQRAVSYASECGVLPQEKQRQFHSTYLCSVSLMDRTIGYGPVDTRSTRVRSIIIWVDGRVVDGSGL